MADGDEDDPVDDWVGYRDYKPSDDPEPGPVAAYAVIAALIVILFVAAMVAVWTASK